MICFLVDETLGYIYSLREKNVNKNTEVDFTGERQEIVAESDLKEVDRVKPKRGMVQIPLTLGLWYLLGHIEIK